MGSLWSAESEGYYWALTSSVSNPNSFYLGISNTNLLISSNTSRYRGFTDREMNE